MPVEEHVYSAREVFDTVMQVGGGRSRLWRTEPERGIALLRPYWNCTRLTGCSERTYLSTMGMLCGVTADCYRALEQPALAAEWYRRASTYSPGGGHAELYAGIVVEHRLEEHYRTALETMELCDQKWREQNRVSRLYWTAVSCVLTGWCFTLTGWRSELRRPTLVPTLHRLIRERETAGLG